MTKLLTVAALLGVGIATEPTGPNQKKCDMGNKLLPNWYGGDPNKIEHV